MAKYNSNFKDRYFIHSLSLKYTTILPHIQLQKSEFYYKAGEKYDYVGLTKRR